MYGSSGEIKRIQSKLRQIGHNSPYRSASLKASSLSGDSTRDIASGDLSSGNSADRLGWALAASTEPSDAATDPLPHVVRPRSSPHSTPRSNPSHPARNLYASPAGQQALATMAAAVPPHSSEPIDPRELSPRAVVSDPSAPQRAHTLASELRQHYRSGFRGGSQARLNRSSSGGSGGGVGSGVAPRQGRRSGRRSGHPGSPSILAVLLRAGVRGYGLLCRWFRPEPVYVQGRLSLPSALLWFVGAVVARLVIETVLNLFSAPIFLMLILTILLTPVVLVLYQTAIDPQSTTHSIRRLVIVMVGLLVGGQLF